MLEAFILIIGLIAGFLYGRRRGRKNALRYLTIEQLKERQENLQKILYHLSYHDDITNDQVEKILTISNSTAERYLKDLEQQGMIVQTDKTGRSIKYVLK